MLDEDRVILMTKLAAFAKREGKRNDAATSYFRGDYVGFQVLKSILFATLAFFILVGSYVLYHLADILQDIYNTDLIETARLLISRYLLFVGVYAVITYIVFSVRYSRMRGRMKTYYGGLRRLSKMTGSSSAEEEQR